jgi:hypothetical protein
LRFRNSERSNPFAKMQKPISPCKFGFSLIFRAAAPPLWPRALCGPDAFMAARARIVLAGRWLSSGEALGLCSNPPVSRDRAGAPGARLYPLQ